MPNKKNNMLYIILPALAIICASCTVERPVESLFAPNRTDRTVAKADMPEKFQDAAGGGPSVIESAMELSAKYTKLVEETTVLKADNQRLTEENRQLKDRLGPCQNNLTQAQKELAEANDLLIEMRIEMNNWKTNILGFRDEMRNAENAQLDALVKILEALGGQAKTETPLDPGMKSAITSPRKGPQGPGDPNQVQPAIQAATDSKQLNG